jgi:hypothetical protein
MNRRLPLALAACLVFAPGVAPGQRYRLRVDTRWQTAAYRGVTFDSIAVADTVSTPGGGPASPDGFAVQCRPGGSFCTFFRPGPTRRGGPVTSTADWTMWGFGVPGLSVRASARLGLDLGSTDVWPGTEPAVQLLEAYGEYARSNVTGRLGRQVVASRLGTTGFDGAAVVWRPAADRQRGGLEVQSYLGWGLARGVALPVTSPALNPLDDFQPRHRQIVAGVGAGWSTTLADLRADYQREVDPGTNLFVSERVGIDAVLRPIAHFGVTAGADYDLAAGWWGSAEASLQYATRMVRASVGTRRYRPHFDLWTIWGAFSPVPYHAVQASLAVVPHRQVEVRGRYERYAYEPADAATPLFDAEENGWRWELGGTLRPWPGWSVDGEYRREYGPGMGLAGAAGTVTYAPSRRLAVTLLGSSFYRPLEFRFNEAAVRAYGLDAEVAPSARLRLGLTAHRFVEIHRRPDAGAFDWDQFRVGARVTVLFANGADLDGLPPAIRLLPGGRAAR